MQTRTIWVELRDRRAFASLMGYHGESCRTLARKCSVHPSMIGHLRSGHRKTCTLQTAKAVAQALQVPPDVLFVLRTTAPVAA